MMKDLTKSMEISMKDMEEEGVVDPAAGQVVRLVRCRRRRRRNMCLRVVRRGRRWGLGMRRQRLGVRSQRPRNLT